MNPKLTTGRRWALAGMLFWAIPLLVITVMVAHSPFKRTVTPVYFQSVVDWKAGRDLYLVQDYHYLPHFPILFRPFAAVPSPGGDLLWRWFSTLMLAWAFWRILQLWRPPSNGRPFFWATVIGLALCLPALRNGQANVLFGALLVHTAVCLCQQRWWLAVGLLLAALVIKPLAIVLLLLAVFVYRPLVWRALVGLAFFAVFPFLFAPTSYVLMEYKTCLAHLREVSLVTENRFADINGLFRALGAPINGGLSQAIRVIAGAVTLGLWWFGSAHVREPMRGIYLLALATTYLMLFNPMTELNSYVILAPVLAALAVYYRQQGNRPLTGGVLVFLILSMGLLPEMVRPWAPNFALWYYPIMALIFISLVVWQVFQTPDEPDGPSSPTPLETTTV